MTSGVRFRPGLWPTLLALGAVATLCALGAWQVRRYHWKQELLASYAARAALPPVALHEAATDPEAQAWRRVRVAGRLDPAHSVALLHVPREMRTGARVLTPVVLPEPLPGGAEAVLVDRGWVPAEQAEAFLREDAAAGPRPVSLVGLVTPLDVGDVAPGSAAERTHGINRLRGGVVQGQVPYRLAPILVVREAGPPGELPVGGWDPPRSRVDHVTYALTWFGMAAVAVAVWVAWGFTRGRSGDGAGHATAEPPAPGP